MTIGYNFGVALPARRVDYLVIKQDGPQAMTWTATERESIVDAAGVTHTSARLLRNLSGSVSAADQTPLIMRNPANNADTGQTISRAALMMGVRAYQRLVMLAKSPEVLFALNVPGAHCRWPAETRVTYTSPLTAEVKIDDYRCIVQSDGALWRAPQPFVTCPASLAPADFATVLQLRDLVTDAVAAGQTMPLQLLMVGLMSLVREEQLRLDEIAATPPPDPDPLPE